MSVPGGRWKAQHSKKAGQMLAGPFSAHGFQTCLWLVIRQYAEGSCFLFHCHTFQFLKACYIYYHPKSLQCFVFSEGVGLCMAPCSGAFRAKLDL